MGISGLGPHRLLTAADDDAVLMSKHVVKRSELSLQQPRKQHRRIVADLIRHRGAIGHSEPLDAYHRLTRPDPQRVRDVVVGWLLGR
jgi:hypothetical protein